jgi:glycosyltransferase involved in cell wall biosynthesis
MLEALGQSQVLGYVERLAQQWPMHLISFEKQADCADKVRMDAMRGRLKAAGISWTPLAYHKAPSAPATAYDIALGTAVAISIARRRAVKVVHARSYVPALMALGVKRATGAKFLFDMRGFWADERVDGGLWPRDGRLYRATKGLERRLLLAADEVVTLTNASAREIANFPYLTKSMPIIAVIPTCADLDRFKPQVTAQMEKSLDQSFKLGYAGSVGLGQLFDQALNIYAAIRQRRTDARLLVLNRGEHEAIRLAIQRAQLGDAPIEIVAVEHHDMPVAIQQMDAAMALYKPTYSALGRAPTKLAEYLGCGVPCVGNINVGDVETILEGHRVGVALRDFSATDHAAAVDRLLALCADPGTRDRCVATARRLFSLDEGVAAYHGIYQSLTGPPLAGPIGSPSSNVSVSSNSRPLP